MPNRMICTVFEEMRKCFETRNFSYLDGLIEEAQSLANRMESKLETISDFPHYENRVRAIKKELKDLQEKQAKLEEK